MISPEPFREPLPAVHVGRWIRDQFAMMVLAAVAGTSALAQETTREATERTPPSHAVPGWYLGMPVLLNAREPETGVDRESLPSMPVYITAPVSETAGTSPQRTIPRPGGEVVLPPHQDTLVNLSSAEAPLLAIGYFVEIGPEGDDYSVRTQDQPDNAWPAEPLASAIRIGTEWVPLNNHVVIEYGVKTGLLQLEFFDVGGLMWGTPFEGDVSALESVGCAFEHRPVLPAVDWAGDLHHVPGQD